MLFSIPHNPKIYHITHVNNVAAIAAAGCLWSDAARIKLGLTCSLVGMSRIKHRRLEEIEVVCHPGTKVGEYVPFYYCPRSIMLYILHMGNSPDIAYTGGQAPIVHLQADLNTVIARAKQTRVRWACSDRNAGAYYVKFGHRRQDLGMINWPAVANSDFRGAVVKEGKQAEFLCHESFPWELVEAVGVLNEAIQAKVQLNLQNATHQPPVLVRRDWYY